MIAGLVTLTLMSKRQASMYVIIGVTILNKLICDIFEKYDPQGSKKVENFIIKPVGIVITVTLTGLIGWSFIKDKLDDPYIDSRTYPVEAA